MWKYLRWVLLGLIVIGVTVGAWFSGRANAQPAIEQSAAAVAPVATQAEKIVKQQVVEETDTADTATCSKGESTVLSPQGELISGLFSSKDLVAPEGFQNLIFDGQLRHDQNHVFLVMDDKVPELTFVQGTWYAVCGDPLGIALRIAGEKASRNPNLTIQVRDLREGGNTLIKQIN